jgi:hypothetical protein
VGVAADYTDVLVCRMDQLRAQASIASPDGWAYAVHQTKISQFRRHFSELLNMNRQGKRVNRNSPH